MHSFHSTGTFIQLAHPFVLVVIVVVTTVELATVVASQGNEIQDLEAMAIESLDHASYGVSHILSMRAKLQKSRKEYQQYLYAAALAILILVCAHWIFSSRFQDDNDMPE
jgi:hypothetical protein